MGRELDTVKRAALFIRMNELMIENGGDSLMCYFEVNAMAHKLQVPLNGWDTTTWLLKNGFREA